MEHLANKMHYVMVFCSAIFMQQNELRVELGATEITWVMISSDTHSTEDKQLNVHQQTLKSCKQPINNSTKVKS